MASTLAREALAALRRSARTPTVLANRWLGRADAERALPALARAKGILDEMFFLAELLSARTIGAADGPRLVAEAEAALALFAAEGWLQAPVGYHPPPPAPETTVLATRRSALGRAYLHLETPSGFGLHPDEPGRARWHGYVANRTLHAWVLEHPGPPRPWLIGLHGYRTGYPAADFVQFPPGWLHETLGLNLLVPVLPLHGPRGSGRRSGDGLLSGDLLDAIHLLAQAVWDVRRLVRWLEARTDAPIAIYGLSLGGAVASLLAGLEPDLACIVAGMPAWDLVGLIRHHVPASILAPAERAMPAAAASLVHVVSPLRMIPVLPRERLHLYGALGDRLVPAAHVTALSEHWSTARLAWHGGSHVSFALEREVRQVLEDALRVTGILPGVSRADPGA